MSIIIAALLLTAGNACDGSTTREVERCLAADLDRADGELNRYYAAATKRLTEQQDIAKLARIYHVEADQAGQSDRRHKHLHDARGTFATYLMTTTDLTDAEIASIMGWSEAEVERIRRIYVDDTARQIALGKRIARGLTTD